MSEENNEVTPTKEEKVKTSMPSTRSLMVKKYANPSKKYQSKRAKQNKIKRQNIINRESRLNEKGWSLFFFK